VTKILATCWCAVGSGDRFGETDRIGKREITMVAETRLRAVGDHMPVDFETHKSTAVLIAAASADPRLGLLSTAGPIWARSAHGVWP
jgi:hypothetical protein